MKRRIIGILTLAAFSFSNIISAMPSVSASEEDRISYEYEGYSVCYDVIDSWEDMQKVSVSIQNTGSDDIENWMLYFDPNGEITDIWNAEKAIANQKIGYYRNSGFNSVIRAGESTEFGYVVKNAEDIPDSFVLCQTRTEREEGYSVSLQEINSWEDVHFQGNITIRNESEKPIEAWKLSIDTNFTIEQITNSWAAEITDSNDGKYELKGTYNSVIQPYSEIELGFLGVKNGTPEIYNYSLSEVKVDEELLTAVITESFEENSDAEISVYASAEVNNNELVISWITDKEITGMEYRVVEITGEDSSVIASTQETGYVYELKDDFSEKQVYIEAYYNGNFCGKSNELIVKNTDGVYSSERVDSDNDNISDYIEELIGTNIDKKDTDEDGLDDYLEFFVLETDPLKKDSDDNGILDGDEDCDSDGLTNSEEIKYGVNPVNKDTDNDKLSDYDELFVYHTNPTMEDTDGDTISDYDELMLGIDPNNAKDSDAVVEQKIEKDSECFSGINVDGMPYKVSMDIKASGYVAGSLTANNSYSYASTYSFDTIGEIPEFVYDGGDVQEVTVNFELENEFVEENNVNIESLNVFKYFDEVNMFVPIKTYRDSVNNIISCQSDSLGTYCVKDVDEWMLNFREPEANDQRDFLSLNNIAYMSSESKTISLENKDDSNDSEPVYVCFALDYTLNPTFASDDYVRAKRNIINVSERLFSTYENINIIVLRYTQDKLNFKFFDNIEDLAEYVESTPLRNNYPAYVENPLNLIGATTPFPNINFYPPYSENNSRYLFVYNRELIGMVDKDNDIRKEIENLLMKSGENIHASFVVPSLMNVGIQEYLSYYADNYNGKVFSISENTIDDIVFNYISNDNKLIKKKDYPVDGVRYVISSNLSRVKLKAPINKESDIDSDGDDLTDNEELIQDSEIIKWDERGDIVLPTLQEVIRYCGMYAGMKYLPDDILDNDKYLKYLDFDILPVRSNPIMEDSDQDNYTDSEEILVYNTNPMKYNSLLSSGDVDYLMNNNHFGASACKEHNQNLITESAVFIANNCYGSVHDYKMIYKEAILDFVKDYADQKMSSKYKFDPNVVIYNINILTQIESLISQSQKPESDPVLERILKACKEETYLNIKQYNTGAISEKEYIEKNDEILQYMMENDKVNSYLKGKEFRAMIKGLDKVNTFVTYACITLGGAVQLNNSMYDIWSIVNYYETIEEVSDILDIIIYENEDWLVVEESYMLCQAAKELKIDIMDNSEVDTFLCELGNMNFDTGLAVGDGYARMKIAGCSGAGLTAIAALAVADWFTRVSAIGSETLKCYTFAEISDSIKIILNQKLYNCEKTGIRYDYVYTGDYIIYDDIQSYNDCIVELCISRSKGEVVVAKMLDHKSVKFFTWVTGNKDYRQTIADNMDSIEVILFKVLKVENA